MTIELIRDLIKGYNPNKITEDEINGLAEMLKHDSFKDIHQDIIEKIKEIEAVIKTRKKSQKKIQANTRATAIAKKRTSTHTTNQQIPEPVITFYFVVDPPKEDKDKDKKDT